MCVLHYRIQKYSIFKQTKWQTLGLYTCLWYLTVVAILPSEYDFKKKKTKKHWGFDYKPTKQFHCSMNHILHLDL